MDDFRGIGDNLIDQVQLRQAKYKFMLNSYETYKQANSLLGYFSQLRDYKAEYDKLSMKVSINRNDIVARYKDLLVEDHPHLFKQLLVSPIHTKWYKDGINTYKKVRNYSIYYYRLKLYTLLEDDATNLSKIKKIIDTIIGLDKYYDLYEETAGYIMSTSGKFDKIMKKHFSDCIYL